MKNSLVAFLLLALFLAGCTGSVAEPTPQTENPAEQTASPEQLLEQKSPFPEPIFDSEKGNEEKFLGAENAPVTIIEYSDFDCGFCYSHFSNTLPVLKEKYIDTGKVKYYFRHFPLNSHSFAQKAGEAAECAGEQGKFWEMHSLLFEKQKYLGIENLKGYASDLDLDSEQFNSCFDSGKFEQKVKDEKSEAKSLGMESTPSFSVNGEQFSGAASFAVFQKLIEIELFKIEIEQ